MTVQRAAPPVPEGAWFKSSYSSGGGGECVEAATGTEVVYVRDSKNHDGPILALSSKAWTGFVVFTVDRAH
ncbi:hypothetical protein B4N89_29725 [Embleya scabrispora]|uniref:DUF397 domain-containing protein n=1 Tax=Embleya scabrispora TaxID=159449 RepID=A0A1T3P6H6_9ACTN|nr:DUF397 domain-containing protein [Embleya scabrispora]OPC84545.1 hypothetical protein B4N89_29725 [Embleya scabrispora]